MSGGPGATILSITVIFGRIEKIKNEIECLLTEVPANFSQPEKVHDVSAVVFPDPGTVRFDFVIWEPETSQGTTAFVTGLRDGWMTLGTALSGRYQRKCLLVQASRDLKIFPINALYLHENGSLIRCVRILKDEKWEFYQQGDPLEFENLISYSAPRKKDRLTFPMLLGYLNSLGFAVEDPAFWISSKGFLYRQIGETRKLFQ